MPTQKKLLRRPAIRTDQLYKQHDEINPQSQSRLLSLPLEIREIIWKYYYVDKAKINWHEDEIQGGIGGRSLRLTCRKVNLDTERARLATAWTLCFGTCATRSSNLLGVIPLLDRSVLEGILHRVQKLSVILRYEDAKEYRNSYQPQFLGLILKLPNVKVLHIIIRYREEVFREREIDDRLVRRLSDNYEHHASLVFKRGFLQGNFDDGYSWPGRALGLNVLAKQLVQQDRDVRIDLTTHKEFYQPKRVDDHAVIHHWSSIRMHVIHGVDLPIVVSRSYEFRSGPDVRALVSQRKREN